VKIGGRSIGAIAALPVVETRAWIQGLRDLPEEVVERLVPELAARLDLYRAGRAFRQGVVR
jgi:hypothetical protein